MKDVYGASLSTPYLYMEDVYVTGLVLRKVDGVKLFPKYKFLVNLKQLEVGGGGAGGGGERYGKYKDKGRGWGGGGGGGGKYEDEDEKRNCHEVTSAILVHGVIEEKQWTVWRMMKNCEKMKGR